MCYTFWFKIHSFGGMDSAWQLKYMPKTYIFMFMHVCISVVIAAAATAVVVVVTVVYIWSVPFCAFTYFLRSHCLLQKRFKEKTKQTRETLPHRARLFSFSTRLSCLHTQKKWSKNNTPKNEHLRAYIRYGDSCYFNVHSTMNPCTMYDVRCTDWMIRYNFWAVRFF